MASRYNSTLLPSPNPLSPHWAWHYVQCDGSRLSQKQQRMAALFRGPTTACCRKTKQAYRRALCVQSDDAHLSAQDTSTWYLYTGPMYTPSLILCPYPFGTTVPYYQGQCNHFKAMVHKIINLGEEFWKYRRHTTQAVCQKPPQAVQLLVLSRSLLLLCLLTQFHPPSFSSSSSSLIFSCTSGGTHDMSGIDIARYVEAGQLFVKLTLAIRRYYNGIAGCCVSTLGLSRVLKFNFGGWPGKTAGSRAA